MTDCVQTAEELARGVVEARLEAEAQILFRTPVGRYPALEAHLLAHHLWNNPEIVAVLIRTDSAGHPDPVRRTTGEGPEATRFRAR
ncbi:divalent-cation tolerance protein CutA [Streptomyces specialis]|uniref:hypothetical protein n=1 Tax=Streptomyces specialis TaxID=498367 RepID=UPI00073E3B87|nr:hypothetical protein [Streptomyces specialis]